MHYVYLITNKINKKIYIGKRKHDTPEQDPYMGSGKIILLAIKKYGVDNFNKEILATFDNEQDASDLEQHLVTKEFCKRKDTYNLHEGGKGGWEHINSVDVDKRKNILAFKEKYRNGEIDNGCGKGTKYWTEETWTKVREQASKNRELINQRRQNNK